MNHLMERDTAAHDLAEVRKLIDSMNSLVNQQQQQQQRQQQELLKQQQQQQQQQEQKRTEEELQKASDKYPGEPSHDPSALGTTSPRSHTFSPPPAPSPSTSLPNAATTTKLPPLTQNNAAAFLAAMAAAAAAANSQHTAQPSFPTATDNNQPSAQSP